MKINEINGSTLAYLGDAWWSLKVRTYLVEKGYGKADVLQKTSVKFVSAKAQAKFYGWIEEDLNEMEKEMFHRGRNFKSSSVPKNTDVGIYRISTGFEALIGYLYLEQKWERLEELWTKIKTNMEG